jgi:hypothetical protein
MHATRLPALALLLITTGCATGEPGDRAGVVVTDSAGIRITTSTAPAWRTGEGWRVDTTPALSIGDATRTDAVLLVEVGGVRLLADGRIAVADGGEHAVRFFTAAGDRDGKLGGNGSGPGEFRGLTLVGLLGDSLLVWDPQLDRATVVAPNGTVGRSFRIAAGDTTSGTRFGFAPVDIFEDGTLLLAGRTGASSNDQGGVRRDPVPLRRALRTGAVGERLAVVPGTENIVVAGKGFVTVFERPFGRRTLSITAGKQLVVSTGDFDGVLRFDSTGVLGEIWRLDRARRAVSATDVEAVAARRSVQLNQLPKEYADAIFAITKDVGYPGVLPPFDAMVRDVTGALWLRQDVGPVLRDSIPHTWTVLDTKGRWLGEVTTPRRLEVHQITRDRILGVWKDDDEVEHIRLYPLRR